MLLLLCLTALVGLAVGALVTYVVVSNRQQEPATKEPGADAAPPAPGGAPPAAGACVENTPHPTGACGDRADRKEELEYNPVCIDGHTYDSEALVRCRDIPPDAPRRPGRCCPELMAPHS